MRRASAVLLLCLAVSIPSLAAAAEEAPEEEPASPEAATPAPGSPSIDEIEVEELPERLLEKLGPEEIAEILQAREETAVVQAVFGDTGSLDLVALFVPLGFFLTLILIVVSISVVRYRNQRQLQETLRLMIEKGADIPPELFLPPLTPYGDLRRGLILVGAGLALLLLVGLTAGFGSGSWAVGLIPAFIGAGYLIVWRLSRRAESS